MSTRKVREVTIEESKGVFSILKNTSPSNIDYNFSGISALRQLLSNEKAKIIHMIKTQNPSSIYDLSKKLNRTFKSITRDLSILERFGFIEFVEETFKGRIRHKPILVVDRITINFKI
jgi:predicted transcriptional regulator